MNNYCYICTVPCIYQLGTFKKGDKKYGNGD